MILTWIISNNPGGCFTNISQALQDILSKLLHGKNCTSYENFKPKFFHALGTYTRFKLEILTINVISVIVYFREIILKSSQNVSETTPWLMGFHLPTELRGQDWVSQGGSMMMSWHENVFQNTDPLWGESTGHYIYKRPVKQRLVFFVVSLNRLSKK